MIDGHAAQIKIVDDGLEHCCIQRLPRGFHGIPEHVQHQDAAGHESQRCGHIKHRPLAGANARLGQRVDVVGDGFETGIGATAVGIGEQQRGGDKSPARLFRHHCGFAQCCRDQLRQTVRVRIDTPANKHDMDNDEADENRQQDLDCFLDAAQIDGQQQAHQHHCKRYFPAMPLQRQQTEHRVSAAGHRNGDGQHVVDDQRRTRNQAGAWADQLGCDFVAATAVRKQLDDLVVGQRNDEHGQNGRRGEIQAELGMRSEREIGFFGAVTGR